MAKLTEASAIGLVDQLLDAERFDAELDQVVQSILRGAGHGETPVEDDESLGWFVNAMQGKDFAEGHSEFMTKRPPKFARFRLEQLGLIWTFALPSIDIVTIIPHVVDNKIGAL